MFIYSFLILQPRKLCWLFKNFCSPVRYLRKFKILQKIFIGVQIIKNISFCRKKHLAIGHSSKTWYIYDIFRRTYICVWAHVCVCVWAIQLPLSLKRQMQPKSRYIPILQMNYNDITWYFIRNILTDVSIENFLHIYFFVG